MKISPKYYLDQITIQLYVQVKKTTYLGHSLIQNI